MNDQYFWDTQDRDSWAPSRPHSYMERWQKQEEERIAALVASAVALAPAPIIALPLGLAATVDQKSLKGALALVSTSLYKRPGGIAVLECFHIAANADTVTVSATNLDTHMSVTLPATVGGEGTILLHGKTLKGIVDKLSAGPVPMNEHTDTLLTSVANLPLTRWDVDDYPTLPNPAMPVATLPVADLLPALERSSTMAADDAARPQLYGVLLRFTGSDLLVASCDGFRLYEERIAHITTDKRDLIIPLPAVKLLIKALKYGKPLAVELKTTKDENQVRFDTGTASVTTRTVEGPYPSYEMLVPKHFDTTATIPTKPAIAALGVLAALKPAAEITRLWANGSVKIGALPGDVANNGDMVSMPISGANTLGPEAQIALNLTYFKDALAAMGECAVVGLQSSGAPALFKPGDGSDRLCVLMPMHIGNR